MRLRPGLAVLRRDATTVQVGTDPRWAVTLTGLSPGATRALTGAGAGADLRVLEAALTREQADTEERTSVVEHLRRARLVVDGVGEPAWALATGPAGPAGVQDRTVRVVGGGRCAAVVATTLGAAGVGTVEVEADGVVGPDELGVGGLRAVDVGRDRAGALVRAVHEVAPSGTSRVAGRLRRGRRERRPDLVVLVEPHAADPVRWRPHLDDDVDHLSVVVREASVLVGPLVRPGHGSCLRCADLHRADRDDGWPALAAQLVAGGPRLHEEPCLAAVAGSLAAAQAVRHLAGAPTALDDSALEVALPDLVPRRQPMPVHTGCGCGGP